MSDYVPGEGDIEIELVGEKLLLKPTLEACLRLSRTEEDGPRVLSDKCLALNLDAITFVIACGLGVEVDKVQAQVFQTGTINLYGKCVRFIHIVSNGGRAPKPAEDKDAGDPPNDSHPETTTAT